MSWIAYAYGLVAGPTQEPVSLDEAKLDRRIYSDDEDAAVERWIKSARSRAEQYLSRALFTQTWKLGQDDFADVMELPMAAPLQSVTHVKYYAEDGTLTTLSPSVYQVDTLSEPGRVRLAPDQVWPTVQSGRLLAVEITYVAGWSAVSSIPGDIVDALHLFIGERDEFRSNTLSGATVTTIPASAEALLAPYRVWWKAPKC